MDSYKPFNHLTSRITPKPEAKPTEEIQLEEWLPQASSEYTWNPPHLRLLQAVTEGKVDRLMLFLPPRHGKSELVTVRYPVYRLERRPGLRVIVGAYNQALAERFSRKSRRIARQRLALSRERTAAWEWETDAGGGMRAVGVGGGVTGLGADLILIDDPVKSREEAESPVYRDRVWDWYRDDLYTRQEPGCAIVLVMTRWHEDDLAGRILRSEEGGRWRVVRLPALAESEAEYAHWCRSLGLQIEDCKLQSANWEGAVGEAERLAPTGTLHFALCNDQFAISQDPLGRAPGAALWPQRFSEADLLRTKKVLGTRSFASLYQGRPLPAEGGLFKREWFQILDDPHPEIADPQADRDNPRLDIRWVRFWDTAAKAGQRSDYWAGALLGRDPEGSYYLAGMVRGRWEYPEAKRMVLRTAAADGPNVTVAIEDSANGTALLQDLRRDPEADGFHFRGVRVAADKAVRAGAWASLAESDRLQLVRGPWNAAFLEEAETFPHGAHDDQIDAVSGAHGYLVEVTRTGRVRCMVGRPRPMWESRHAMRWR